MASIDVRINNKVYTIACSPNDEAKVKNLANFMDKKARNIISYHPDISENTMLLMLGMVITDEALKIREKSISLEKELEELHSKTQEIQNRQDKFKEEINMKDQETVYILEKIVSRVGQINDILSDEIKTLTTEITEPKEKSEKETDFFE